VAQRQQQHPAAIAGFHLDPPRPWGCIIDISGSADVELPSTAALPDA
jgi:hypothetical protein